MPEKMQTRLHREVVTRGLAFCSGTKRFAIWVCGTQERPVCRFNIKFHGTLFKQAVDYVGLQPEDCFALATYKIHSALQKQDEERVPYVFLIISVPDYPRELIEQNISDDWAWSRFG